jgi:hypothetical protein
MGRRIFILLVTPILLSLSLAVPARAEFTIAPVYTLAISMGSTSPVPLGRYERIDELWGMFASDFEVALEMWERLRLSARVRGTLFSFPAHEKRYSVDTTMNISGNLFRVLSSTYFYSMLGGGVGWLNEGNGVVNGDFPAGIIYLGFGVRSVRQPSLFVALELSHTSAFQAVDPGAGLNSLYLRTGFEF